MLIAALNFAASIPPDAPYIPPPPDTAPSLIAIAGRWGGTISVAAGLLTAILRVIANQKSIWGRIALGLSGAVGHLAGYLIASAALVGVFREIFLFSLDGWPLLGVLVLIAFLSAFVLSVALGIEMAVGKLHETSTEAIFIAIVAAGSAIFFKIALTTTDRSFLTFGDCILTSCFIGLACWLIMLFLQYEDEERLKGSK